MKTTVIAGWMASICSLGTMLIGHMGNHELSWMSHYISTFAANAPNGAWITSSMLISAMALFCIGILISKFQILGSNYVIHLIPLLIGAAVSGLIVLAAFQETASSLDALKALPFSAIRQQSFHDAGLMVFYYSSIFLTTMAGISCTIIRSGRQKIIGILITCLGPGSFLLMTTSWPASIGISHPGAGLKQRAALSCIWLAMALMLWLASNPSHQRDRLSWRSL